MNKLKVIQLLPELNIGGVERGTRDFSEVLINQGHESIVILTVESLRKILLNMVANI